jgi:hypothetical protein
MSAGINIDEREAQRLEVAVNIWHSVSTAEVRLLEKYFFLGL